MQTKLVLKPDNHHSLYNCLVMFMVSYVNTIKLFTLTMHFTLLQNQEINQIKSSIIQLQGTVSVLLAKFINPNTTVPSGFNSTVQNTVPVQTVPDSQTWSSSSIPVQSNSIAMSDPLTQSIPSTPVRSDRLTSVETNPPMLCNSPEPIDPTPVQSTCSTHGKYTVNNKSYAIELK